METRQLAFFSYARADATFALKLAKELKAAGLSIWIDQLDINLGQRWDREVEKALATCPRMVVVLSPAAVESNNVMDEVSYALEEGKIVIPVLHKDCKIPFRLRRVQYADFRTEYEVGMNDLINTLRTTAAAAMLEAKQPSLLAPIRNEAAESNLPHKQIEKGNTQAVPDGVIKGVAERLDEESPSAHIERPDHDREVQQERIVSPQPTPVSAVSRLFWTAKSKIFLAIGLAVFGTFLYFSVSPKPAINAPRQENKATSKVEAPGALKLPAQVAQTQPQITVPPTSNPAKSVGLETLSDANSKVPEASQTLDRYYLGRHTLGVNRVNDFEPGLGSVNITRTDGKLHLEGSTRKGVHYLKISGEVEPVSPLKFYLQGEISGVPDLSFMNVAPTPTRTNARFEFSATLGRKYWRMHQVNGRNCVCDDNLRERFLLYRHLLQIS